MLNLNKNIFLFPSLKSKIDLKNKCITYGIIQYNAIQHRITEYSRFCYSISQFIPIWCRNLWRKENQSFQT